jgi:FkbM family methyltransferase
VSAEAATRPPPIGLAAGLGLARSLAIYYGVPGRRRRLAAFYRAMVGPGDLVFDIGAHVGNRLRAALDAGARVVGVEPQPACRAVLERLYARNPKVALVAEAIGAEPGTTTLHVSRRNPTVSSTDRGWIDRVGRDPGFARVRWDAEIDVAVTTLDRLIERFGMPAYCKIDVEGSEAAVLAGLSRPLPRLSFETLAAAPEATRACLDRLAALGDYRYNLLVGEGTRFALDDWVDGATLMARLADGPAHADVHARLVGG